MTSALFSTYKGRVHQVIEALDYGDAVSNQVMAIHRMLLAIGLESAIYCKWFHASMASHCRPLEQLQPNESDLVIFHFSGFSEFALPWVEELYCTKICAYHNITPHEFFVPGTAIYNFCLKGREQVPRVVRGFHYFWGDSQYNLDELIAAGAPATRCAVVPIAVAPPIQIAKPLAREFGAWLFVGRVVANKGQVDLVRLFARVRAERPEVANRLYLVGGLDEQDAYSKMLRSTIQEYNLEKYVVITGKLSDEDVDRYFALASLYVSASQHEGFGVPLVEAGQRGLPVIALQNSAVGETLGFGPGLVNTLDEAARAIVDVLSDEHRHSFLLEAQRTNALRFSPRAVEGRLCEALDRILPRPRKFSSVSVVICTYNRASLLDRCLDYLQYQTDQRFEVVVINGPSTDDTEQVINRHAAKLKVGRNPEANLSKSRNLGIELSSGDLIAFIDDDALPFDDWIATLLREFNARPLTLAALGGPVYYAGTLEYQCEDIGFNNLAETKVNVPSSQIGRGGWVRSLLGTNSCFRADVLRDEGGFDEQFDYFLDESELCYRLQKRSWIVGYCHDLYLRHEFAQSANRQGGFKYNWFSICKNTAYFVASYSGLDDRALQNYLRDRLKSERIAPIESAMKAGQISQDEYEHHIAAIESGMTQGLIDARAFPKTRRLSELRRALLPFCVGSAAPLVDRDVRRFHICLVTKEFPPFHGVGGIGTLYYHLAVELLQMGHYVTVVTPGVSDSVYRRGRFVVRFTGPCEDIVRDADAAGVAANLTWSLRALRAIAAIHKEHPVDVVDCALWDAEGVALAILPPAARPALVVRLVTPFLTAARHNGWEMSDRTRDFCVRAELTLIEGADAVLPISQSIARTIEADYALQADGRWQKVPCGIAYWPSFDCSRDYTELTEINGRRLGLPSDARLLLFVGRLERRKGVDVLVQAARIFLPREPNAWLVLAGQDVDGWIPRIASEVGSIAAARVIALGQVDTPTREKLLHAAYCLVFPSRYESFGLVPLEAFVHATPVIAARAGAIPEVIVDGDCGLLYDAEDPEALAHCVDRMLNEPGLHDRLVAGAERRIREFSSRRSAILAVELYAGLIASRTHQASLEIT